MTDIAGPPKETFRLSMLIYDSRYRSMTIQIVVLILVLSAFFWLARNAAINLAALGKPIRFNFLFDTAGYDINQRLLEYASTDTHLRATLLGLLNTLLVAFMGCITATIIGLFVGLMRLSPNWLVARLAAAYVEIFRNVPLLLWIILFAGIISATLPQPRDFRGDDPAAEMLLGERIALTNRGFYVPEPLFSRSLGDVHFLGDSSLRFDVSLDLVAILVVLFAGLFISRKLKTRADAIQEATGERPNTLYLRLGIVILPVLAVLWALGFYLGYPALQGFNFRGGITMSGSLIALWMGLSLYTANYIAEIVRSGIEAISKGQTEAAASLGLKPNRIMSLVILPQALRIMIPPMISQYLNLIKNSSLAIAIGYMDLVSTLGGITLNQTGREMESILLLMAIYLTISLSVSGGLNWYNNRVKLVER